MGMGTRRWMNIAVNYVVIVPMRLYLWCQIVSVVAMSDIVCKYCNKDGFKNLTDVLLHIKTKHIMVGSGWKQVKNVVFGAIAVMMRERIIANVIAMTGGYDDRI